MRNYSKFININILLTLSVSINIYILSNVSNPICRTKKIWSIRGTLPERLINRKNTLLKALSSNNIKKGYAALDKFRKIAPYFLPFIKKNFSQLNFWQRYYLRFYFVHNMIKVSDIKIMCNQGNKSIWYLILDNHLLVIGDEKGIVDSFPLIKLPQGKWVIDRILCNIQDSGQKKFAIMLSSDAGNLAPEGTIVLTPNGVYKNAELVIDEHHNDFAVILKSYYSKTIVIHNNRKSELYDNVLNVSFGYNSARFGFIATKNGKIVVVIDEEEKGVYDDVCNVKYKDGEAVIYIRLYVNNMQN